MSAQHRGPGLIARMTADILQGMRNTVERRGVEIVIVWLTIVALVVIWG